jgi:hypothetical protein
MDDPNLIGHLHRVNHPECIFSKRQSNLEHPRPHPLHGFGNISLAALRSLLPSVQLISVLMLSYVTTDVKKSPRF